VVVGGEQVAKNLYEFWGSQLTDFLNRDPGLVVNLASREYSSAVDFESLCDGFVDVDFYEIKDGQPKIVAIYAKRARGIMADWIVRGRVDTVDKLKEFDLFGYKFDSQTSNEGHLKFVRSL